MPQDIAQQNQRGSLTQSNVVLVSRRIVGSFLPVTIWVIAYQQQQPLHWLLLEDLQQHPIKVNITINEVAPSKQSFPLQLASRSWSRALHSNYPTGC